MTVFKLFSRRMNARGDLPPLELPQKLRTQVCHHLRDGIGVGYASYIGDNPVWRAVYDQFIRELGVIRLTQRDSGDPMEDCANYLLSTPGESSIDLIELTVTCWENSVAYPDDEAYVQQLHAQKLREDFGGRESLDETISDLNSRFRENDVPLQFVSRQLVRTDSEYLHQEATIPAFGLLHDSRFKGAEHEFMTAHEHYRHGRWDDAVSEANQAFESTMKCALDIEGTGYNKGDVAGRLVEKVLGSKMFRHLDDDQRGKLNNALAGRLPPVRNAHDHGAGATPRSADQELAAFALHLSAANIVLIVSALNRLK